MPLESASFIADLVSTNPAATDQVNQGYQQVNLVKAVLKGQFPNWTSAALTSTNGAIDGAVTMLTSAVWTVPASATAHDGGHVVLKGQGTDTDILLQNNSGGLSIWTVASGTSTFQAAVRAGGSVVVGANATPVSFLGEIRLWAFSVGSLPTGWHVCDGTGGTVTCSTGITNLLYIQRIL